MRQSRRHSNRAQTAIEYLLLIALSLAVVLAGIAVLMQINNLNNTITQRVDAERNDAMAMVVR